MSSALLRRLAPLSLFAVPLLIPVLVSTSNAATNHKHKHKHHANKASVSAKATTSAKTTSAAKTSTTAKASTAAVAAAPNMAIPAAARGVLFGTSMGTDSAATVRLFPNARIGRVFWSSPKTTLPALPSSYAIWLSFKTSPSTVASGQFNAQFATMLQAWNRSGRTVFWTWQHEADRHAGFSSAQFRQGWAQLLSVEKKYPSSRVRSMSILTGIVLAPNRPHGDPANWYVNADVLGFDCYVPASVPRAMAYARAKHKPWAIPEFGADNGDAGNIKYIQDTINQWAAYPPVGASWYNNTAAASFSQPLRQLPQTTTYLRALAAVG